MIDSENPVAALCIQGTRAEFAGKPEAARALYQRAWETARDDVEACIAAHYLARFQASPQETLRWNQEALQRAHAAPPEQVQAFFPSLYLSLGQAFERLGDLAEAQACYQRAASLGYPHQGDEQCLLP